jgi:hypothetical protein
MACEFSYDTAVATPNDERSPRILERKHRDMDERFVIGMLIERAELDVAVEEQHPPEDFRIDDVDFLKLGFAAMNSVGNRDEHV